AGPLDAQAAVPDLLPVAVEDAGAGPGQAHPVAGPVGRRLAVDDLGAAANLDLLDSVGAGDEAGERRRPLGPVLLAHPAAVGAQAGDDARAGRAGCAAGAQRLPESRAGQLARVEAG